MPCFTAHFSLNAYWTVGEERIPLLGPREKKQTPITKTWRKRSKGKRETLIPENNQTPTSETWTLHPLARTTLFQNKCVHTMRSQTMMTIMLFIDLVCVCACCFFNLDEFLDLSGQDLASCCYRLFDSDLFQNNTLSISDAIIDRAIQVQSCGFFKHSERGRQRERERGIIILELDLGGGKRQRDDVTLKSINKTANAAERTARLSWWKKKNSAAREGDRKLREGQCPKPWIPMMSLFP